MIVTVLATALSFGACSQKKETATATSAGQPATQNKPVNHRAQKSEEKHCFPLVPCLNRPEQPAAKGGEIELKLLKRIMVVAFLVTALGLGACAQHKEVMPPRQKKGYGDRLRCPTICCGPSRLKGQVAFRPGLFFLAKGIRSVVTGQLRSRARTCHQ